MTAAIDVLSLTKRFRLYHERNQSLKATVTKGRRAKFEDFDAVHDVSFTVPAGSTFGIIGANGSGKSTLLKCLANILTPENGQITTNGRVVALLELGAGFHPELTGRENVHLNGAILGMTRRETEQKFDEIVSFSGLERFIDSPVKNYSSGMVVRLGFAIAINVNPEILIIDEVLAVGDQRFQHKCYEKIQELRRAGKTIVLVSHSLASVVELCDEVLWLDGGKVVEVGDAASVVSRYLDSTTDQNVQADGHSTSAVPTTQEVRMSNVSVSDGRENFSGIFPSGSPIAITFALESISYVGSAYVHITIFDDNDQMMWQNGTHAHEIRFDTSGNAHRLVTCAIRSLPILEGVFRVSMWVSNESGTVVMDHHEDAARFNVLKSKLDDFGLLFLESDWTVN